MYNEKHLRVLSEGLYFFQVQDLEFTKAATTSKYVELIFLTEKTSSQC